MHAPSFSGMSNVTQTGIVKTLRESVRKAVSKYWSAVFMGDLDLAIQQRCKGKGKIIPE